MQAARRSAETFLPQAELRRRAILDAALRVVAAGGAEAVTHRRVAAEAGVPLGSTTYYFASRDDLLREAFRQHAAQVYASLDGLADEMPLGSRAELVAFLVELVRRELLEPALILVEYELIVRAARDPELAREVAAYERSLTARLGEALERLRVTPALDAARVLIALVRGFELECLTRPGTELDALRARLELIVGALASSRATPGAAASAASGATSASASASTSAARARRRGARAATTARRRGGSR